MRPKQSDVKMLYTQLAIELLMQKRADKQQASDRQHGTTYWKLSSAGTLARKPGHPEASQLTDVKRSNSKLQVQTTCVWTCTMSVSRPAHKQHATCVRRDMHMSASRPAHKNHLLAGECGGAHQQNIDQSRPQRCDANREGSSHCTESHPHWIFAVFALSQCKHKVLIVNCPLSARFKPWQERE
jgi:hypothetical protein